MSNKIFKEPFTMEDMEAKETTGVNIHLADMADETVHALASIKTRLSRVAFNLDKLKTWGWDSSSLDLRIGENERIVISDSTALDVKQFMLQKYEEERVDLHKEMADVLTQATTRVRKALGMEPFGSSKIPIDSMGTSYEEGEEEALRMFRVEEETSGCYLKVRATAKVGDVISIRHMQLQTVEDKASDCRGCPLKDHDGYCKLGNKTPCGALDAREKPIKFKRV